MSVAGKLARNIFSSYVGFFGSILIAFFLSPFLVHSLGDTRYGIWTIIAALTGYMALLDLGISSAVAKYVAQYEKSDDHQAVNRVLSSAFFLSVCITGVLVMLSPWLADAAASFFDFDPAFNDTLHTLIIVASIDMAVFVVSGVFVGATIGFQRYEILNGIRLTAQLIKALLFVALITRGYGLLGMVLISLAANIATGLALFAAMRHYQPTLRVRRASIDRATCRQIVGYSKFTFIAMVATQIVYYSDALVIGYFMSAAAITYYTIAWSLGEYTNGLIVAISGTFFPAFSEQQAGNDAKGIRHTYLSGTRLVLVVSNLVCVGMLVLGDRFIGLWMGEKYAVECAPILLILFASLLIKNPQSIGSSLLLGTANYRQFSLYNLLFAGFNLGLNIWLIQDYGLIGVALGTAITQGVFYGAITPALATRVAGIGIVDYLRVTYLRSLPSLALLFVLLYAMKHTWHVDSYARLFAQALLGSAVYLAFVYRWYLNDEERAYVITMLSGLRERLPARASS